MEWVETTGRTVEEALDAALDELGVDENDVEYEVLARPRGGLLGRFGGEARIRARVKPISREKPGGARRRSRRRGSAGERLRRETGGNGSQPGTATKTSRNRRRRRRGGGGRGERPRQEQEQGATVDEQPDISVEEQVDQAVDF